MSAADRRRALAGAVVMLVAGVALTSCLMGRGDPTRFYVLTSTVPAPAPATGPLGIGLGPIALPGYLRRPMLATRVDDTRVRYADFDRWAEPLPAQFARTLGQDLSALADSARIVPYPWYPATGVDVVVRVDVSAFEADAHGNARLDACWSVRDPRTSRVRSEDCSSIAEAAHPDDPGLQVAALSRTVGELAERIASGLPRPAH